MPEHGVELVKLDRGKGVRRDAAYNVRNLGKAGLGQPKFKHLRRYRWVGIPDLSLPFDELLSLGGRSEEISQICVVWGEAVAVSRYQFPELRMSVLHQVVRVLIFADWGCAVVLVAMAARLAFLRAGELPAPRGLLTLRRPLASELSREFHAYNRQFIRLMLALALVLAVGAFLFWLDILFLGASSH